MAHFACPVTHGPKGPESSKRRQPVEATRPPADRPNADVHHRHHGIDLDERLGVPVDPEPGHLAGAEPVGQRVHVKGSWLPPEGTAQPVLALEVKLQDTQSAQPSPSPNPASCAISGGRVGDGIELEGNVSSGSSAGFRLQVNGNRASSLVDVDTAGASFQCTPASGPNAPTPAQCQAQVASGAKVHVRGTLTSCSASAAQVRASEVRVQK